MFWIKYMIIKAITVPTPRRIKNKLKRYCTKERIAIYSLISGGIVVVSLTETNFKYIPTAGLLYCGFVYKIIERTDKEILDLICKDGTFLRDIHF